MELPTVTDQPAHHLYQTTLEATAQRLHQLIHERALLLGRAPVSKLVVSSSTQRRRWIDGEIGKLGLALAALTEAAHHAGRQ